MGWFIALISLDGGYAVTICLGMMIITCQAKLHSYRYQYFNGYEKDLLGAYDTFQKAISFDKEKLDISKVLLSEKIIIKSSLF